MYGEQIQSVIRNVLQFVAGVFGLSAYATSSTLDAGVAVVMALCVLLHAVYAARQSGQAKEAVTALSAAQRSQVITTKRTP